MTKGVIQFAPENRATCRSRQTSPGRVCGTCVKFDGTLNPPAAAAPPLLARSARAGRSLLSAKSYLILSDGSSSDAQSDADARWTKDGLDLRTPCWSSFSASGVAGLHGNGSEGNRVGATSAQCVSLAAQHRKVAREGPTGRQCGAPEGWRHLRDRRGKREPAHTCHPTPSSVMRLSVQIGPREKINMDLGAPGRCHTSSTLHRPRSFRSVLAGSRSWLGARLHLRPAYLLACADITPFSTAGRNSWLNSSRATRYQVRPSQTPCLGFTSRDNSIT